MEDEDNTHLQKRLSVDESSGDSNSNENSTTSISIQKPLPVDKAYEHIRGHERHILFHFFTLFSISFLVGVAFIHLSLWMNSHLINPSLPAPPLDLPQGMGESSDIKEEDRNSMDDDSNDVVWAMVKTSLDYTGNYFHETTRNISRRILHTW